MHRRNFPWISMALVGILLAWCFIGCQGNDADSNKKGSVATKPGTSPFWDPTIPFIRSTLALDQLPPPHRSEDVIPRALVLRLKDNIHIAYDMDLVLARLVWSGMGIEFSTLAPRSYQPENWSRKSAIGLKDLNHPKGKVLYSLPGIPGVETEAASWADPRPNLGNHRNVGRGPLENAKWKGILMHPQGPILQYTLGESSFSEFWKVHSFNGKAKILERILKAGTHSNNVFMPLASHSQGLFPDGPSLLKDKQQKSILAIHALKPFKSPVFHVQAQGVSLIIEKSSRPVEFSIFYRISDLTDDLKLESMIPSTFPDMQACPLAQWTQSIIFDSIKGSSTFGQRMHFEQLEIPLQNPWNRRVRFSAIEFMDPTRAVLATFDGDIWSLNLPQQSKQMRWRRIAGGFDEPQALAANSQGLHVLDRSGITLLRDRNSDGETDEYVHASSHWIQTAESREFPMDLKIDHNGNFIVATGGQREETANPHAGCILKVAPSGNAMSILSMGMREPYLGLDRSSNILLASDQQGHWVPSTPLYSITQGHYCGYPIKDRDLQTTKIHRPLTWVPHHVNASAGGLVKLNYSDDHMPENSWLVMNFAGAELGLLMMNHQENGKAVYMDTQVHLPFPPLKAVMSPDGKWCYATGFNLWGSTSSGMTGLARIAPTHNNHGFPRDISCHSNGIAITFAHELDPKSLMQGSIKLNSWNYKRSNEYGSAHYKADGSLGQDIRPTSIPVLAKDKKTVLVAYDVLPDVDQLALSWDWKDTYGNSLKDTCYFSSHLLTSSNLFKHMTLAKDRQVQSPSASKEAGQALAVQFACTGCHSTDGKDEGKTGPGWKGLFLSTRETDRGAMKADEAYLRESILNPNAKIVTPYTSGMPPFQGILSDAEVDSLIMYIKSLE